MQTLFEVTEEEQGQRLDKWLASKLPNRSRSNLQQHIEKGFVKLVYSPVDLSSKTVIKAGESYSIELQETTNTLDLTPDPSIDFEVIHEDQDLMVINKPAGLTVHPGAGQKNHTLIHGLLAHHTLSSIGGLERPGIVHRLDKDTSGLMLIAKNDTAHYHLSKQLKNREISRKYQALVYGCPHLNLGTISSFIGRDPRNRLKMQVTPENMGKPAVTHYKVLQSWYDKKLSLLECTLETGRTHQIRVHLTYKNYPIVGDKIYTKNVNQLAGKFKDDIRNILVNFPRQALHAYYIEFMHPTTQTQLKFQTALPQDMVDMIEKLENK